MKQVPAEFRVVDKDGNETKKRGTVAVCPECDNREWIVFQLTGVNHFHLQCSICAVSFCPVGGNCKDL